MAQRHTPVSQDRIDATRTRLAGNPDLLSELDEAVDSLRTRPAQLLKALEQLDAAVAS